MGLNRLQQTITVRYLLPIQSKYVYKTRQFSDSTYISNAYFHIPGKIYKSYIFNIPYPTEHFIYVGWSFKSECHRSGFPNSLSLSFEVYLSKNTTSISYLFWSTGNIYTFYFSRDFCAYCGGNWRSLLTPVVVVSRLILECCFEALSCYVVFENDPIVLFSPSKWHPGFKYNMESCQGVAVIRGD